MASTTAAHEIDLFSQTDIEEDAEVGHEPLGLCVEVTFERIARLLDDGVLRPAALIGAQVFHENPALFL